MLSLLIAVRNFTIAIVLAWMGFSVAPDSDDQSDNGSATPSNSITHVFAR